MPKTHVIKETADDGSAREGTLTDGVSGPAADPPRKSAGARSGKKSTAKRVPERRPSAEDGA